MVKVLYCQSTSPEIRPASTLLVKKINLSLVSSEETFHQKLNVPGPVNVVCMELDPLSGTAAMRAASAPS